MSDADSGTDHVAAPRTAVGVRHGIWAVKAPDGRLESTPAAVAGTVLLLGAQVATPAAAILGGLALLGNMSGGV